MQHSESGGSADRDATTLPQLPYLAPWYRAALDGDRLVLSYAHAAVVLQGKAVELLMPVLLPLLDGTLTLPEIEERIGQAAAPAIRNALATLASRGVLRDGPPVAGAAEGTIRLLAAKTTSGLSEEAGCTALRESAVAVLGTGEAAAEVIRQLRRSGLQNVGPLDWDANATVLQEAGLVVAAPEPGELPELEAWNRTALDNDTSWLQVLPFDGRIAAVGPLYLPGRTCCYECFQRRRAANVTFSERDYWALERSPAAYPQAPPLQAMAAGLAATLVLRHVGEQAAGQSDSYLPGAMHAIEWDAGLEVRRHFVFRVPRCSACSGERGVPSPWHS